MRLSARRLNRTLLARQGLLERRAGDPLAMVEHLVGLQAQENLPPYLSLAARLEPFDPYAVSSALESRALVRMVVMRGTIHLLTADDALVLRQWTQPVSDRERRASRNTRPALHVDRDELAAAVTDVLAEGPLPMKALGESLAERFAGVPAHALAHLARTDAPLAQVPPRGTWGGSGGVVYQLVDRWVGAALRDPDPEAILRRYLAAYGPASAADAVTWSGRTGLAGVLSAMDDLEVHEDVQGRRLYDVPGAPLVEEDAEAPVRLLGLYDNVWLSHASRDRVTAPDRRTRWMGQNGGLANTVVVDGWLEGLWRVQDGRPVVVDTFRRLTRTEQSDLDDEVQRVADLLVR